MEVTLFISVHAATGSCASNDVLPFMENATSALVRAVGSDGRKAQLFASCFFVGQLPDSAAGSIFVILTMLGVKFNRVEEELRGVFI